MFRNIGYVLLFMLGIHLEARADNSLDLAAKEDSVVIKSQYDGIGPVWYELPPEKTKEQLLEEEYVRKHEDAEKVSQYFRSRKLLLNLNTLGRPLLLNGPETGFFEDEQNDHTTIVSGLQESIRTYLQLGNQQMVANLQNSLGIHYAKNKDYDKAESCFLNAIAIEKELKDDENILLLYGNMAMLQKFRGKKEDAYRYFEFMHKTAAASNDLNAQAFSLEQLALLKAESKRFREAQLDLIKKVLPLYKRARNVSGRANAYNSLAYIYSLEEKYTQSRWFYLQAIKVASAGDMAHNLSYSLYYLAGIKKQIKEYKLAIEDYLSAASYASKSGDELLKLRIYDELGDVYIKTKDYVGASSSLKEYENIKKALILDDEPISVSLVQVSE